MWFGAKGCTENTTRKDRRFGTPIKREELEGYPIR
jgi:hypothetical protein